MRGINIGDMARRSEYCDICQKHIYMGWWDHIERHKRELQAKEDERVARERSERFKDALRGRSLCK